MWNNSLKNVGYRQLDHTDCGPACLASICAYYKLNESVSRIRQFAGTNKEGTNLLGLMDASSKLGLHAKAVRVDPTMLNKLPLPCISHLHIGKKWFHFVVIYKIHKDQIVIMDPASGSLNNIKLSEFLKDFTGICLLLKKNENFIEGSPSVSLSKRFIEIVQPYRTHLLEALGAAVLYSLLGLSTSIFVRILIDMIIPSGNTGLLNMFAIFFLILILGRTLTGYLKNMGLLRTGLKIDGRLIFGYYRHIMKLPMNFFNTMQTGEIISRLNDAVKIRSFINTVALELVVDSLIVIFTVALMIAYSIKMSIIILVSFPLYLLFYQIFNRINKIHIRKTMENAAVLESSFVETFKNIETIKTATKEDFFTDKMDRKSIRFLTSIFSVNKIFTKSGFAIELITSLQAVLILWIGSALIFKGEISQGEMLSFYTLFGYLSPPLLKLILANKNIQDAIIAAERLFQIMDLSTESTKDEFTGPQSFHQTSLVLENISFKYPGQLELLKQVSFTCQPYSITTIMGESGAGKSTLLSLMLKLSQPNSGKMYLNGIAYEHLSNHYIRSTIGYIPQKPALISGPVKENIAFGEYKPSLTRIENIIREVGLSDKIRELPQGIESHVSEDGNNFSGGEKQKIMIARVLYKSPSVIVLDEPTSSMDPGSEKSFFKLLLKLRNKGKIIIIVSHKKNFKNISDQVISLKDGKSSIRTDYFIKHRRESTFREGIIFK